MQAERVEVAPHATSANGDIPKFLRLSLTQESILWFFINEDIPLEISLFAEGLQLPENTVGAAMAVLRKRGFVIEKIDGVGYRLAEDQKGDALQALLMQPKKNGEVEGYQVNLGLESKNAEKELVDRAISGHQEALGDIYQTFYPRIYRYILARTGNSQEAEDLTGDVFIKVLEAIDRFQWRESPFSAWLFRIAHNTVISRRRRDGARGRSAPLKEGLALDQEGPDELVENRLILRDIMEVVQRLPEAQRQVVILRFGAGLTVAETARAMNKGEGNVKVIQHKAILKLRQMMNGNNGTSQL